MVGMDPRTEVAMNDFTLNELSLLVASVRLGHKEWPNLMANTDLESKIMRLWEAKVAEDIAKPIPKPKPEAERLEDVFRAHFPDADKLIADVKDRAQKADREWHDKDPVAWAYMNHAGYDYDGSQAAQSFMLSALKDKGIDTKGLRQ